jgi:hypothetical protein
MIDLPVAGVAENGKLPFEGGHREPGLASGRILRGLENRDAVKDEETSRLKQETNQERIALVQVKEASKISVTRFRQAGVVQYLIESQPQGAADEPLEFVPFHGRSPSWSPENLFARNNLRNVFHKAMRRFLVDRRNGSPHRSGLRVRLVLIAAGRALVVAGAYRPAS